MSCKTLYGGYVSPKFIDVVYSNKDFLVESTDVVVYELASFFHKLDDKGKLIVYKIIDSISLDEVFYKKKRNDTRYGFIALEIILQFLCVTNSVSDKARDKLFCFLYDKFFFEIEKLETRAEHFSEELEVEGDDFDLVNFIKHHIRVFDIKINSLESYRLIANEFMKLIIEINKALKKVPIKIHQYILLQFMYEVDFSYFKILMQSRSYTLIYAYVRRVYKNMIVSACQQHCDFIIKSSGMMPYMFNLFGVQDCIRLYWVLYNTTSLGLKPSLVRIFRLARAYIFNYDLLVRNRKKVRTFHLSLKEISQIYKSDVYVLALFKKLLSKRRGRRILFNCFIYFEKIYRMSKKSKYTVHGLHNESSFERFSGAIFRSFMLLLHEDDFYKKAERKITKLTRLNNRFNYYYNLLFFRFKRMPLVKKNIRDNDLIDKCLRFNLSTICYNFLLHSKGNRFRKKCRRKRKRYKNKHQRDEVLFFHIHIIIKLGFIRIWSEEMEGFSKLFHYYDDYMDQVFSLFKIR